MPLRIRSILAANDRSGTADTVVRAAGALCALTEADLHVVHAMEVPFFYPTAEATIPGMELNLEEVREAQREQLRYSLPPTVLVKSCEVAFASPSAAILQRAQDVAADLIVMGPHRPRPVGDQVLGSTADRLVRTSEAPCLIVHAPLSLPLRRLLVPSDLSEASGRALQVALVWAAALRTPTERGGGTEVRVVHLVPTSWEERRRWAEPELENQVADALDSTGVGSLLTIRTEVREADEPADAILDMVREERVDLLVLGTHGRSALGRALLGSVSSAVARRSEIPTLLVPPRPPH